MKIICVMAMSVDGRITAGDSGEVHLWTSREDKEHFSQMIEGAKVIILGSNTYQAYRGKINYRDSDKLRIVMTRDVTKFKEDEIPGKLEFTDESAVDLVNRLRKKYDKILLTGGGVINGLFFKENLVDELVLTVEPKIFGKGQPLISSKLLDCRLELLSIEKLSEKGTLLLKYKIRI